MNQGDSACRREKLLNWNLGPGHEVAQEWAKQRAADATTTVDNVSIFNLPVGVRSSEQLKGRSEVSMAQEAATENDVKVPNKSMPWSALTNAGREAVTDFTSTFLNGKHAHKSNKQGVLSARAASMLESERDSSKKWIPIVEMQYRGGQYKGRCQGGLPEGKGRLVLGDGSIYDGTWRYGKRSGPGTLYFIHGDVFQGSWRDDLMHGKGWCFFFTQGIGGLQTFGRERQMVKAVSTQRMGMPSLAILKMDSDTGNLYVWMLKEQGTLRFGNMVLL